MMFCRKGSLFWLLLQHGVFNVEKMVKLLIFSHCPIAAGLLSQLLLEFRLCRVWPCNGRDMFQIDRVLQGIGGRKKKLWNVAIMATCWTVWLEWNSRIFEDIEGNLESLWERVKYWVWGGHHYYSYQSSI